MNSQALHRSANLDPAQQLQQRRDAIADLDQRVTDVSPRLGLQLSTLGLPPVNSTGLGARRTAQFSRCHSDQNQHLGLPPRTNLDSRKITHWRFQRRSCSSRLRAGRIG